MFTNLTIQGGPHCTHLYFQPCLYLRGIRTIEEPISAVGVCVRSSEARQKKVKAPSRRVRRCMNSKGDMTVAYTSHFFIWYLQPVCMSTCWNRSILGTYFRTNLCGHVGKQKTINYTVVTRGIGKYLFKRTVMCQIVSRFHQQVKVEWCHTIYSRVFTTQPEERSRYSHIGCDNLDFHDVQS